MANYTEDNTCFDESVGIRDLCEPKSSKSNIYLNDIYINKSFIESVITNDYAGAEDFFLKKRAAAIEQVSSEIYNNFQSKFKADTIINQGLIGYNSDNAVLKQENGFYSGLKLRVKNSNAFFSIYVDRINLYTDYTGEVEVKVIDYLTNKEIDTITVDCVTGKISISLVQRNYVFNQRDAQLFFCYDTTGINSYKTLTKKGLCCGSYSADNKFYTATGAYSDNGVFYDADLIAEDHTFGMTISYSMQCNPKMWICQNLNKFSQAIAYKTAELITLHGIMSAKMQRANSTVSLNSEQLTLNANHYSAKYVEQMQNVLANMQVPADDCFSCNDRIKTITHFI